jgi:D-tyrosyl-tRNA(Tyr) deacylase
MRACLQRVARAQVTVDGEVCGRIDRGILVLLGVLQGDEEAGARQLAQKVAGMRIFDDAEGKMNLSVSDIGGGVLVVSQFTLAGDCRKGRRPSFDAAAQPEIAQRLYEVFAQAIAEQGIPVSTGRFRAHMMVELVNDGPVTFVVET